MKGLHYKGILLLLVFACLGNTAFASYDYIMPTTLEYDLAANYMIEIPANINLNEADHFSVRAYDVDLPDGQELVISLDKAQTNIVDNILTLTAEGSNNKTMECNVCVVDETDGELGVISSIYESDYVVAVFASGNDLPVKYGGLFFTPQTTSAKRGHYTTALYYTVEIKDYM